MTARNDRFDFDFFLLLLAALFVLGFLIYRVGTGQGLPEAGGIMEMTFKFDREDFN